MRDHPNRQTLECLSVRDLPDARAREMEEHVRDCAACAGYLAKLEAARETRLAAVPAERFVAQVAARRDNVVQLRTRRLVRTLAGVAALVAAAASLVLVMRRPGGDLEGGGVSMKGEGASVFRSRDGQVKALASDGTIRAGDALRIVITQSRPARVAAWFVDAHGQVDRVLPEGSMELPAGESPLPGSSVVNRPCVDLALVIVVGIASADDVERRMKAAVEGGTASAGAAWVPSGAIVRRLRCE